MIWIFFFLVWYLKVGSCLSIWRCGLLKKASIAAFSLACGLLCEQELLSLSLQVAMADRHWNVLTPSALLLCSMQMLTGGVCPPLLCALVYIIQREECFSWWLPAWMDAGIFIVCPVASLTPSRDRNNKMEMGLFKAAPCHTFAMICDLSHYWPLVWLQRGHRVIVGSLGFGVF